MLDTVSEGSKAPQHADACKKALEIKGRQLHAYQDFYAHAITRKGSFTAFSAGVTGDPYNRDKFWPSSYGLWGEHELLKEPIQDGTAEYKARYKAAQDFANDDMEAFMPYWWTKCACVIQHFPKK